MFAVKKSGAGFAAPLRHKRHSGVLFAFNFVQRRLASNHFTGCLNNQGAVVVAIAAYDRANHRARVSVQELKIQLQNRLTRFHFRALSHQTPHQQR